jgi:hypothetical protein
MKGYLQKTTSAAPLAVFRIALGLLLFASIVRFWARGWIQELYIDPAYHFSFYGFEFVKPLGSFTYVLFAICGVCALLVAVGLFYRVAATGLFLSFTYIELMDKSTYLNHYYFISMICLLMIVLPAHASFSVDSHRKNLRKENIPLWCLDTVKLFVAMLYIFAGLAKVNSDWLLHAQPLRIWLPAKNDLPLIGPLLNYVGVAYAFSWIGCLYDLTIPFFLQTNTTRPYAYAAVVIFHVLTSILFPIGMFPFVMIATALIFFPAEFHHKIIQTIQSLFRVRTKTQSAGTYNYSRFSSTLIQGLLVFFFCVQLCLPLRYMLYPGELFWTEEGYRFSWRVMLMEKAGYAQFQVKDNEGKMIMVDNTIFLTPLQEKMMSTQPDMILQFAHILRDYYAAQGINAPQVYVDSYVTLNGRLSKPFINSLTDLAQEEESFLAKPWILPFDHEIKGF